MNIVTILRYLSYGAVIALLISLPIRIKKFSNNAGTCQLVLTRKKSPFFVFIAIFAPVMLLVLSLRSFPLYLTAVLDATPILALEIAIREMINRKSAGVYEQMLIVDGRLIKRRDILALPTLEWEENPNKSLKLVTKTSGEIIVNFENLEERNAAVQILKNWV
jgi:hypothetical protein